jgi:hypothetical protein
MLEHSLGEGVITTPKNSFAEFKNENFEKKFAKISKQNYLKLLEKL